MFIANKTQLKVGDRIVLTAPVETFGGVFTEGHLFRIESVGERGFNLVDFDGLKLSETKMIQHLFRKVSG